MRYIADLHIHSPFSRATSRSSHLQGLAAWAAVKGIQLVGTGDFTHPGWLRQVSETLEEAEPGFYRLNEAQCQVPPGVLPPGLEADVRSIRFLLTAEISSIYKRGGRVRKVHNILFAPDLAAVRRINSVLAGIGNIEADGRPILGLDSRDLLAILLDEAPQGFLVPAHIWTPWFSLFGSKSGFDAIEECFGDLSSEIFALETGLSSDPDMNRLVSALDRLTLISNSDCHSPSKLGREANILETGFDYFSLREALRRPRDEEGNQRFLATVEFFPEEGKYHGDGHRKCEVCLEPAQTRAAAGLCPVCGRPLTVGVLNRVMELADRETPRYPDGAPGVSSLVPLTELLGEIVDCGPASKKVTDAYVRLIREFGSEFALLLQAETAEIAHRASPLLAEAIARVRAGRVIRRPGYDGEYGVIRVFTDEERSRLGGQRGLFGAAATPTPTTVKRTRGTVERAKEKVPAPERKGGLNPEQEAAVVSGARHILVKAGPGTGKTHTLVQRVVRLVSGEGAACTVLTFTNRAADELRQRLATVLGQEMPVMVATLHGYCLHWLRRENAGLQVAGPEKRALLLRTLWPGADTEALAALAAGIQDFLAATTTAEPPEHLRPYFVRLAVEQLVDIDGVVPAALSLLGQDSEGAAAMRRGTGHLLVDEFQDLNERQYALIRTLAATSPVFAIGDPDQAIYGFRGASPRWFFRFAADLQAEQHQLWRNYRSAGAIVTAAAAVIAANPHPEGVVVNHAVHEGPGRLHLLPAASAKGEAAAIVRQIEFLLGGSSHREIERLVAPGDTFSLSDIAVLYRTGRQAEVLAAALSAQGLPVQVVDLVPFYLSPPVSVLYHWLLLAAGRGESLDLLALLRREPGIGVATLRRVEEHLALGGGDARILLRHAGKVLPGAASARLAAMEEFLTRMQEAARSEGLVPALTLLAGHAGLDPAQPEVHRLLLLAENFGPSLEQFAEHLQRSSDSVVYDPRAEAVTFMTLHAAKGLEFRVVFLAGAEEGLLPLAPRRPLAPEAASEHLAEERRLFYVGLTRAREVLYLCHARTRTMAGRSSEQQPSRFLAEIPPDLFSPAAVAATGKRRRSSARQLTLFG